jgi:hypothetical protein
MSNTIINDTNKFNFDLAYEVYKRVYSAWQTLSDREQKKARRQVEAMVRESGFNGNPTGLISEAALETVINHKKGIKPNKDNRTALEHPVTYTNVALHCLNNETLLSYDDYFNVWFDNLVTTITTNEENYRLTKFQKNFEFGVDCWKKMYEEAGIKLVERPRLMSKSEKRRYGII